MVKSDGSWVTLKELAKIAGLHYITLFKYYQRGLIRKIEPYQKPMRFNLIEAKKALGII